MSETFLNVKLYIAGPMTGLPAFNYPAFDLAYALLTDVGYTNIITPTDACRSCSHPFEEIGKHSWDWYIRSALRMISEAEGVALLPGWEDSKGATFEHQVASKLEIPRLLLTDWIKDAVVRPDFTVVDGA